ncbi:MAG TPA: phage holin family protein [Thermoanaerobaculia bacterium]|nr:phage holin family protein [Thermoanaerobaculia bacterium]
MRFLLRALFNALALVIASWLLPGIEVVGGIGTYVILGLLFGVVNATIGTLLKVMTCPLIVLTLGLFTLVINGLMLQLTSWFARQFGLGFLIEGFWSAFLGALVVTIVSATLSLLLGEEKAKTPRPRPT